MIILDENILDDQRQMLRTWRIPIRQIGYEVGRKGMSDVEIIPFLLGLRRPTFFTLDADFYKPALCHARYCLVYLDVGQHEAAYFLRRLVKHTAFDTEAKRMGAIVRVAHTGISLWRPHVHEESGLRWNQ